MTDLASNAQRKTDSDLNGRWVVSGVASGRIRITVEAPGFNSDVENVDYANYRPGWIPAVLRVGSTDVYKRQVQASQARLGPQGHEHSLAVLCVHNNQRRCVLVEDKLKCAEMWGLLEGRATSGIGPRRWSLRPSKNS